MEEPAENEIGATSLNQDIGHVSNTEVKTLNERDNNHLE